MPDEAELPRGWPIASSDRFTTAIAATNSTPRAPARPAPSGACPTSALRRAGNRLAPDVGGHRGGVLGGSLQRPCPAAGGADDEDLADGGGPVERRGVEGSGDARHDGTQGGADERAGDPEERGGDRGGHRGEGTAGDLGDAQPERLGAGAGASAADSAATLTEPVAEAGGPDGEEGVGRGSVRGSGMAPDETSRGRAVGCAGGAQRTSSSRPPTSRPAGKSPPAFPFLPDVRRFTPPPTSRSRERLRFVSERAREGRPTRVACPPPVTRGSGRSRAAGPPGRPGRGRATDAAATRTPSSRRGRPRAGGRRARGRVRGHRHQPALRPPDRLHDRPGTSSPRPTTCTA